MKLAKNFHKAWSTHFLAIMAVFAGIEVFVQGTAGFLGPYGAIAIALVSAIGVILRALPQPDKKVVYE